jgi:hypothetical protein
MNAALVKSSLGGPTRGTTGVSVIGNKCSPP